MGPAAARLPKEERVPPRRPFPRRVSLARGSDDGGDDDKHETTHTTHETADERRTSAMSGARNTGERHAAWPNARGRFQSARNAAKPPMLVPSDAVCAAPGRVRNSASIAGLSSSARNVR